MKKLNEKQYAAFAANAKTLDSLRRNKVSYVPGVFEVTKVIVLSKEDFEKFSEDISSEYPFHKDNREFMSADPGGLFRCLMVRAEGEKENMLIAQGRTGLYLGYGRDYRKINLYKNGWDFMVEAITTIIRTSYALALLYGSCCFEIF